MKKIHTRILSGLLAALTALVISGCGGGAQSDIYVKVHGPGTVRMPTGADCQDACSFPVTIPAAQAWLSNYKVRFTATAEPGYQLLNWNHPDCVENTGVCTATVPTWCDFVMGPVCYAWGVGYTLVEPVFLDMSTVAIAFRGPHSSCVIGHGGEVQCWGFPKASQVPPLSNPRQVTSHAGYGCVQDDTGVVCWGNSLPGTSPQPLVEPYTLAAGDVGMCALDAEGVKCWRRGVVFEVPQLQAPTHLRAGRTNMCVDDVGGTVCWEYDLNGTLVK